MSVYGQVAIVFGGAGGIGQPIIRQLLEKGAKVCCTDLPGTGEKEVQEWCEQYGKEHCIWIESDVCDIKSVENVFDKVKDAWKSGIDIVINTVGILNEHDYLKSIDINLTGVHRTLITALNHMGIDKGGTGGCFISLASIDALIASPIVPVYAATKAGVVQLTRGFSNEMHFKRHQVRIHTVLPGAINTPLQDKLTPEMCYLPPELLGVIDKTKYMGPEPVADCVLSLLEDKEKNGQVVLVTRLGGVETVNFDHEADYMSKML